MCIRDSHRICDVWATDGGSRLDVLQDVVPVQRNIFGQQLDDALRPGLTALSGAVQLSEQARRRAILKIAEQVDADALVLARDLDPANQGDPVMHRGRHSLVPALS